MIQCVFGIFMATVLLVGATPGWSQQYYIYTPKPVAAEEKVQKKDGVLVQEVPVKKGDTLSRISRRFSGRASYFPQILLFNEIKNPDLIYTGTTLRIPVSRSSATGQAPQSPVQSKMKGVPSAGPVPGSTSADLKKGTAVKEKKRVQKRTSAASEQRQFERAVKVYRQNDYPRAVELFDRFLADYPTSALAADASLYKAECYLKQSNQ